jgi:kumamolisin
MSKERVSLPGTVRSVFKKIHEPAEKAPRRPGPPFGVVAGRRGWVASRQEPTAQIRAADPEERLEVTVVLRRAPDAPELPSLEEIAAIPFGRRRHLTHEEFASRYSAERRDIAQVQSFANAHGLTVTGADASTRTVRLEGTVADLGEAFGVRIDRYTTDTETFLGHADEPSLPAELAQVVEAVRGLDTFPVQRAQATPDLPQTRPLKLPEFLPTDMAKYYDFPPMLDGSGETIGIIALGGGYDLTVLKSYFDYLGMPLPQISFIEAGAGNNYNPEDGGYTQEIMMDLEMSGSLAPGARHVVYFGKNDYIRPIQAALADTVNRPSVLSVSFASPEALMSAAELPQFDALFQEAAVKGVTVFVASGDTGSSVSVPSAALGFINNLAITNYPTAHPGVLGVGGTVLTLDGEGQIVAEEVWSYLSYLFAPQLVARQPPINLGASGGGQSIVWALPDYQKAAGVAYATGNRFTYEAEIVQQALSSPAPVPDFGRGVPDVAAVAETYKILVSGTAPDDLQQVGGTSASTPLWASLIARFNQALGRRCGFLNPTLYNDLTPGALRPITVGSNGAYAARPELRWNAAAGLGVPNGVELLRQLEALCRG